jgi:hypothetical protein
VTNILNAGERKLSHVVFCGYVAQHSIYEYSDCMETRDHSPLLLASARATGPAAILAQRRKTSAFLDGEAGIQELFRMNDDAPWEHNF